MKKNILGFIGLVLIIGIVSGNSFDQILNWSTAELSGYNTSGLVMFFGGFYLFYFGLKKDKENKKLIVILTIISLILFIGGIIYGTSTKNIEKNNQIQKVLSGKIENNNDKVMKDVFDYYKKQSKEEFYNMHMVDNSNFLEADSFTSIDSINKIIELNKKVIVELDNYDQKIKKIKDGAREIIKNSNVLEEQKKDFLLGFDKSYSNKEREILERKKNIAMKKLYEKTLVLYNFMLSNFNKYKIGANVSCCTIS